METYLAINPESANSLWNLWDIILLQLKTDKKKLSYFIYESLFHTRKNPPPTQPAGFMWFPSVLVVQNKVSLLDILWYSGLCVLTEQTLYIKSPGKLQIAADVWRTVSPLCLDHHLKSKTKSILSLCWKLIETAALYAPTPNRPYELRGGKKLNTNTSWLYCSGFFEYLYLNWVFILVYKCLLLLPIF